MMLLFYSINTLCAHLLLLTNKHFYYIMIPFEHIKTIIHFPKLYYMKINFAFFLTLGVFFLTTGYFFQISAQVPFQNTEYAQLYNQKSLETTHSSLQLPYITHQVISKILYPNTYSLFTEQPTQVISKPIVQNTEQETVKEKEIAPKVIQKQDSQPKVAVAKIVLSPTELDPLFEKYATLFGVDSSVLKYIAKCESNYNPAIISKNGLYGGLYQYSASTWISTRRAMGLDENPNLRFDAQQAIHTTAFKISQGGIGAWPTCGKRAVAQKSSPQ